MSTSRPADGLSSLGGGFKENRTFAIQPNNFDLLRLFAASQVAYLHISRNLEIQLTGLPLALKYCLEYFPGVPIFFVISGFLISISFDRNPDLRAYTINRILRIYPALWISTLVTLLALALFAGRAWTAMEESGQGSVWFCLNGLPRRSRLRSSTIHMYYDIITELVTSTGVYGRYLLNFSFTSCFL